jgi:hypothetical protein
MKKIRQFCSLAFVMALLVPFIGLRKGCSQTVSPPQSESARVTQSAEVPSLIDIGTAVNQNRKKITNVKLRTTLVMVQSPDYSPIYAMMGEKPLLVEEKVASITKALILHAGDDNFVDEVRTEVGDDVVLETHKKYWHAAGSDKTIFSLEKSEFLDKQGQVRTTVPAMYSKAGIQAPTGALGDLQLAFEKSVPDISYPATVKVGYEMFNGLKCIRLSWGEKGKDTYWGYHLVCPERDWKILCREVYRENHSERTKIYSSRHVVESLQKVGDSWIPTTTFSETKETGADGKERVMKSKLTVDEIAIDVVDAKLLFQPQVTSGTIFLDEDATKLGGPPKVMGGSIKGIVAELREGDFSSVEENIGDLSGR